MVTGVAAISRRVGAERARRFLWMRMPCRCYRAIPTRLQDVTERIRGTLQKHQQGGVDIRAVK